MARVLASCASTLWRRGRGRRLGVRRYSNPCTVEAAVRKGLVLGVYSDECDRTKHQLTGAAERFNDVSGGKLMDMLRMSGPTPGAGVGRVFYNVDPDFCAVVMVGLGQPTTGYNDVECIDESKETVRIASGIGCQILQDLEIMRMYVEAFGHAESAAEGACLGVWLYQDMKDKRKQVPHANLELYDDCDWQGWQTGLHKAQAQNLARELSCTPCNRLTPRLFAQKTVEIMCKSGVNVEVKVQGWAKTQRMDSFLSVAKGSCEQPIFLEISYYGSSYEDRPVVLVGPGITFDCGGLCLKQQHRMGSNMLGASCVVASIRAIAEMNLPINLRGLIPLCENMPGHRAYKPGDVVTAMNGKHILVEDTACGDLMLLADALFYSQNYWPKFIVDVSTLAEDAYEALDTAATAVLTNSDVMWERIYNAAVHTGDRVWRLPLWGYYTDQMTDSASFDLRNVGTGEGGAACKAAAFLQQFVPCGEWLHLDATGTLASDPADCPYLKSGVSGRPTRTLVEFLSQLVCKECN